MMKRLMTGLMAVAMSLPLAGQGLADGFTIRLSPGSSGALYSGQDNLLKASVGAGQYVYVQWSQIETGAAGLEVNPGEPVMYPLGRDGEPVLDSPLTLDEYVDGNWYIWRMPATANYGIVRYDRGYAPPLSVVRVYFLNRKVPVDTLQ